MRLAFSSLGCPDYTFDQIVAAASRHGYQGFSVRTVAGTTDLLSLPEFSSDVASTRRKLSDAGLELLCVSTGVRFTSESASERQSQLSEAKGYIDLAAELGSPFVRIFGGPIKPEMDRGVTMANVERGFRASAEHAATRGVDVLLETHDTFATGRASRDLLDRIGHPRAGAIWDILHSLRYGEQFSETVSLLGPHIKNVHLKDSSDYDENHFDIKLCGEGTVPIRESLRLLDGIGYEGFYEFEWEKGWHPEIPTAEVAFPHFVTFIHELRSSLHRG